MEFSIHNLQKGKMAVHILQAVLIVISWVMDIVVFRKASIDGRIGWHFALVGTTGHCFISIAPLIFLTMVGRFPRTRKFANPYALASVDLLFAILWLSAFASVANWNGTGKCGNGCGVSKGVVALGVIIWFLWIATTAMSVYGLLYFRREGYLPGASRAPNNAQAIDPDKEAFSTAPHDDEYAPVHHVDDDNHDLDPNDRFGTPASSSVGNRYDTPNYSAAPSYVSGGYQPPQVHDEPTGYSGYSGAPGESSETGGRAKFPTGRYDDV